MQPFWLVRDFCDIYLTSSQSFATLVSRNKQNYQPMKKTNLSSCVSALVLAAALFAATFPAAGQSILININQANPSAVQFIAVGANSFANSSVNNLFGVDLISYFTIAPASVASPVGGTLTPTGTTVAYNQWFPDNLNVANNVDLNLYAISTSQVQNFSTLSQAFTNSAIINLSGLLASLPITGTQGNIFSGDIRSPGSLIGKWVVVPEPSVEAQVALGAMVLAGLALVRRSRRVTARQ
jgi:MYXO-CTERM domain-containing protein